MVIALIFFVLVSVNPLNAWSLFGSKPLTPEEKIQQLQQQQVDNPNDPAINYNLGVALYRAHKFDQAKANFERTLAHTTKTQQLETQTLFNMANASLKHALSILPPQWEHEETIEPELLDNAISLVTSALEHYQKFLSHQPENIAGSTNKKYAEEIKKKLEEKKKQQQENKKNNKDKQQKDQKNDQQQEQQKKDQQEQKQDQQKDPQQQDQSSQQKQQQKEQRNEQNDQKQQKNEPGQSQKQQQQENAQQDQQESGAEQAQAGQAQQQQESSEDRRMRALLENLQSEETARQKMLVRHNAMKQQQPPQQGQKPW